MQRSTFETYRAGGTTLDIGVMVKLVLTVRGFRGQLDERLRRIGHSVSRMETLAAIMNMPDPKSQSDVARRLRVEGATVTRMIDILSREGLVERAPDPGDRRVNLLTITPVGETVLAEIFDVYDNLRGHVLAGLDEADRNEMHRLLDLILAAIDNPPAD
jgi:MarR family transcriptional regulator for hemolysin